ncbi:MAG: thiamine phosphate synthase [Verrucomicrobiia bacterium]
MTKTAIADCRLYGFIDTAYLAGRDPAELARRLIAGGVDVIQVRAKQETYSQRVALALAVVRAAQSSPVPIIINDDVEAAFETGADGVHLGQEDWALLPREQRREKLIGLRIIGISTHSLEQAQMAERDGADYIGVGPVFATGTKPGVKPVGVELVRKVAAWVAAPFFAIGGITPSNLDEVLAAGATRVAVVSAILCATDAAKAAAEFKKRLSTPRMNAN